MIRFYVMGQKGLVVMQEIIRQFGPTLINKVISAKDRNVQNDYYQEISTLCKENEIPFFNRNDEPANSGGYAIAIGWRWIIPESRNLIVFHDSLLPKYRGFNPLVTSLLNGDTKIGVTALWASEEADAGDIIGQSSRDIQYPIKIAEAIDIVSGCYAELCLRICDDLSQGRAIAAQQQDLSEVSYSIWRDDDDYFIDWSWDATYIDRFVDSVGFPYKGAAAVVNERRITILDVSVVPDVTIVNRVPGKVFRIDPTGVVVMCGTGLIKIEKMLQTDGQLFQITSIRTRFR